MATLALGALASSFAAGGSALAGTTLIGGLTVAGAAQIGASVLGGIIDRALFSPRPPTIEGPVLPSDTLTASINSQDIPRLYGLAAVGSHIVWASRYNQVTTTEEVGGKGAPSQESRTNAYFVGISYSLAEYVDKIEEIYFDGTVRDYKEYDSTFYNGLNNVSDPLMQAIEGADNVNPMLGLSHLVFDALPLTNNFNNRPPQLRIVARRNLTADTLPELLKAIMADDGIDLDVSRVPSHPIRGAAFPSVGSPRSRFTAIASPRLIDLVEGPGGSLAAIPRFGPPEYKFKWTDLVVNGPNELPVNVSRGGPSTVPSRVFMSAPDPNREYGSLTVTPSVTQEGELVTTTTPEVLSEEENLVVANNALLDDTVRRTKISCVLPPSVMMTDIGVGTIIEIQDKDGAVYNIQITSASFGSGMAIEGETVLPTDPAYDAGDGSSGLASRAGRPPVAPVVVIMDLPWAPGAPSQYGTYVAATADPLYQMGVFREQLNSGGADHDLIATLNASATIGVTTTAISAATPEAWDAAGTVGLEFERGALSSRPQDQVEANNLNALALQAADGTWEVIQFTDAAMSGPNGWTASNLFRGAGGVSKDIPVGSRVVLLNNAVEVLEVREKDIGVERTYEVGPGIRPIGDDTYVTLKHTAQGSGTQPLPVRDIKFTENGEDILIEWTRDIQPTQTSHFIVQIYDGNDAVVATHTVTGEQRFLFDENSQVAALGAGLAAGDTLRVGISEVNVLGQAGPNTTAERVIVGMVVEPKIIDVVGGVEEITVTFEGNLSVTAGDGEITLEVS